LFDPKKVAILSNGRYIFIISRLIIHFGCCISDVPVNVIRYAPQALMSKHHGSPTVVIGGRPGVPQQYAGGVGGVASTYSEIQNDLLQLNLEEHPE
jgi:hypothetical protein